MTVAQGCFLGVGIAESATADALSEADREFQPEAWQLTPNDAPERGNTDGWEGTNPFKVN